MTIAIGRYFSKVYRSQDPRHRARVPEIEKQAEPLRNALDLFPTHTGEQVQKWENDFNKVKAQLAEEVDFTATADVSLTWLQYMLTRAATPETVVETGVWIGSSSFTLLSALEANGKGQLVSIDFPPFKTKNRVGIGRLVPERLYHRWDLHLGPSKALLPKVAKPASVDIFIHDSDHTYVNMTAEFERAWDLVKPGGYIISDDSSMNDSVIDFVEKRGCNYKFLKREKGGTIAVIMR